MLWGELLMEQYKIKTILYYLRNRLVLSNEITKGLYSKPISLEDYNCGIRVPRNLVSTKREINLVVFTNDEIDEFMSVLELLLNRYDININSSSVSFISYLNMIIDQLVDRLDVDTNYVARDLLLGNINKFKSLKFNELPSYGINPGIQGNIEVNNNEVVISNKGLKRSISNDEEAILFGLSLKHRDFELLARDLYICTVENRLCIVTANDYYYYDVIRDSMYGISEVRGVSHLNDYLYSQDLELMINGYYTNERLVKILGHINRLRNMPKEEHSAYINISVQGSLFLTDYINNNTNIRNEELDNTRIYLQKHFYDRLIRKGQTDLRVLPKIEHGHPLERALTYGGINPKRCDINLLMRMNDQELDTSIGHITSRGIKYEDSICTYKYGYQYKK